MRRLLVVIGLEGYAVLLALYRSLGSVHTDEAKYLLNIPYPHPPLGRFVLNLTESLPYQEIFWRVVFATMLVQAVWLVAKMAKEFSPEDRLTLCGLWVFSASVIFQSGTVMMALLTAMQGLVFVWLAHDANKKVATQNLGWISLFWVVSLFTAYQAVLYLPIVLLIFHKAKTPLFKTILAVAGPLLLVTLYVATNPLAAASFTAASGQNKGLPLEDLLQIPLTSWLWAGSAILSVAGLIGIIRGKQWALLLSFLLVCLFHVTSYRSYYPVLFLPLLIGGVVATPGVLKRSSTLLAMQIVTAVFVFAHTNLTFYESDARTVMRQVNQLPREGSVLIAGSFGHHWQYESRSPVLKYRPSLLAKAKAVVCLEACPGVFEYGFYQIENIPQEVWIRK